MVELVTGVDVPMIGWECGNCEEPYNSQQKPNQHMCSACRKETIWQLPEDHKEELRERLRDASEGDKITVVPDHAASMAGIVTDVDGDEIELDGDGDVRLIDVEELELYRVGEEIGDDLHYLEVTPEEEVEVDNTVEKRVKTPIDGIVHDAAASAGLDPDTAEVEGVRIVDGELELRLRGEA